MILKITLWLSVVIAKLGEGGQLSEYKKGKRVIIYDCGVTYVAGHQGLYYRKNLNKRTVCYVVENHPLEKRG